MEYKYYDAELDLDGTADELFVQARNGYIDDADALRKIEEILRTPAEQKYNQADYVAVLREIAEDKGDRPYVFAQYKKDILDGCGSDEVRLSDTLTLNVMNDRGMVVISLEEAPDDTAENGRTGAAAIPAECFLKHDANGFDELVSAVYAYNMQDR